MRPQLDATQAPSPADGWFRALAGVTTTAIFVYRERLVYVNRAAEELSGYPAAELLEMRFSDLVHPDHRHLVRGLRAAGPSPVSPPLGREVLLLRKDGGERWVELSGGRVELDGRPAWIATVADVSERKRVESVLTDSEERLDLAQKAARSVTWEWTLDSDELSIDPYADELFGFAVHELVRSGREFLQLVHPEDRRRLQRSIRRMVKHDENLATEIRFISPRGEVRWLAERALALRDDRGWVIRVIGVAHDITERKIAEDALFQEKERAYVTLASIADGVIRTDSRGAIDYLNPVAQKLTGWTLAEAYGRPSDDVYRVVDQDTGKPVLDPVRHCLAEQREVVFLGNRLLARRDGMKVPIHDSAAPIRNRGGKVTGAVLVFRDLTPIRQVEREMDHLATHDPLTGLVNRREFESILEETVATTRERAGVRVREHAMCHLDLDKFKLVNDSSGRAAGDQMIRQIAYVIQARVRPSDVLARLGGDEFAILLRDCPAEQAQRAAHEVLEAIRGFRFHWEDRIYSTGASIGLAPFTTDRAEPEDLLRAADAACYVAKETGGNRIHVYEPGDKAVAERRGEMQWITRIHKAIAEDRFLLYHQPIKALDDSNSEPPLSELFVRLHDDDEGLVPPEAFIPAAERYGLVSAIDKWVLAATLKVLGERREVGCPPDARFALNVSGQSLGEDGFLERVVEQFERSRVAPERILFEVTETAAIADLPNAVQFISVLKGMGCRFVLDDFGQGLSSFGYLKNLPLDYLKIDGEFVRGMVSDPIQIALVASIHEIGDVMGLRTIAEAVEDEETLEALARMGIDYAQGFQIAEPRPLLGEAFTGRATASV